MFIVSARKDVVVNRAKWSVSWGTVLGIGETVVTIAAAGSVGPAVIAAVAAKAIAKHVAVQYVLSGLVQDTIDVAIDNISIEGVEK